MKTITSLLPFNLKDKANCFSKENANLINALFSQICNSYLNKNLLKGYKD